MSVLKSRRAPWIYALVAVAALFLGSPAWANIIGPGGSGAPDVLTQGTTTLLADTGLLTWTYTTTDGTTHGDYESQVYSDSANTFCAGCLDFVFIVSNAANSADKIDRVTDSAFGTFKTDMGELTNLVCAGFGPNINPTTVDRSNDGGGVGNVAGFNYTGGTLAQGDCTSVLVVETNAKNFKPGNLSVIDSGTATVASFAPTTTVPEPASMALLGTALFGAYGLLRRKLKV